MSLDGKVALVTGGGSGIGSAILHVLAERGCKLAVNNINEAAAEKVVSELVALGARAIPFLADVSNSTAVNDMVQSVVTEFGAISILVNNAGHYRASALVNMSDEEWDRMLGVHLTGAFHCCRAAVPVMRKLGAGKIINISSTSGMIGEAPYAHYCAAKAGVLGLTKALAKELAVDKINVNAIAPGFIWTPIHGNPPPDVLEKKIQSIPWGRLGQPQEVAYLAAFLASDEADYITGQTISVNGGLVIVGI